MIALQWEKVYYREVNYGWASSGVRIGALQIPAYETLDFGEPIGAVQVLDLREAAVRYGDLTERGCRPQLAAVAFGVTRRPQALNSYFPLTKILDKADLRRFYQLAQEILIHPAFDLRVLDTNRHNIARQLPEVAFLVAGHLAEIFFYRRDILECLLSKPRHFWLYTTFDAFKQDGGVAGGNFNPTTGSLQLVLARLFEGYYGKTPGAAPFLHEFGHMLDYFDGGSGKIIHSHGLLPGMRPEDGPIYTPEACECFLAGKKLELERYVQFYEGERRKGALMPIGHPYVFQNDSEFVAGYLEMFFRNPHYFAMLNPDLFQGFALLFKQDPRQVWAEDFPFYVQQNRNFYLSGKRPGKPGVRV